MTEDFTYSGYCQRCGRKFVAERRARYCTSGCRIDAVRAGEAVEYTTGIEVFPRIRYAEPVDLNPPALEMVQLDLFSANLLEQTMALATAHREELLPLLKGGLPEWPFEDRVLATLVEYLREPIRQYHVDRGPGLQEMFTPNQIEHIDTQLGVELAALLSEGGR